MYSYSFKNWGASCTLGTVLFINFVTINEYYALIYYSLKSQLSPTVIVFILTLCCEFIMVSTLEFMTNPGISKSGQYWHQRFKPKMTSPSPIPYVCNSTRFVAGKYGSGSSTRICLWESCEGSNKTAPPINWRDSTLQNKNNSLTPC